MTKKEKIKNYEKLRVKIKAETFKDTDMFFCKGCERMNHEAFWTLDHIIKRSQSQYFYDKEENLFPLCLNCNIMRESKGDNYLKCVTTYNNIKDKLTAKYNSLSLAEKKE